MIDNVLMDDNDDEDDTDAPIAKLHFTSTQAAQEYFEAIQATLGTCAEFYDEPELITCILADALAHLGGYGDFDIGPFIRRAEKTYLKIVHSMAETQGASLTKQ